MTELELWEQRLTKVLNQVDAVLEEKYGSQYPLKNNRPQAGTTGNPRYDGLFSLTAKYSLGLTNNIGPHYLVEFRFATFVTVPISVKEEMYSIVLTQLNELLHVEFPKQILNVSRDGEIFRITGNLDFTGEK